MAHWQSSYHVIKSANIAICVITTCILFLLVLGKLFLREYVQRSRNRPNVWVDDAPPRSKSSFILLLLPQPHERHTIHELDRPLSFFDRRPLSARRSTRQVPVSQLLAPCRIGKARRAHEIDRKRKRTTLVSPHVHHIVWSCRLLLPWGRTEEPEWRASAARTYAPARLALGTDLLVQAKRKTHLVKAAAAMLSALRAHDTAFWICFWKPQLGEFACTS
jgi:hypothetical protein